MRRLKHSAGKNKFELSEDHYRSLKPKLSLARVIWSVGRQTGWFHLPFCFPTAALSCRILLFKSFHLELAGFILPCGDKYFEFLWNCAGSKTTPFDLRMYDYCSLSSPASLQTDRQTVWRCKKETAETQAWWSRSKHFISIYLHSTNFESATVTAKVSAHSVPVPMSSLRLRPWKLLMNQQ